MENNNEKKNIIGHNPVYKFGRTSVGTPDVSEYFTTSKWINFGEDNLYPQELIRLYQNASTMHKQLVDRKVDMVAGLGWTNETPFILNEFSDDSLNIIVKKVAFDQVIFNGFYLEVIFDKSGKSIAQIEHIPYEKMRVAKYDCEKEGELEGFYFSKDWTKKNRKENKPEFLPKYNPDLDTREYPNQVMFFRTYTPGMDYYSLPSYSASINWLKLDYEISTYHLKNVQNGLMPGMIIVNKSGIPTAQEREEIYRETKASLAGSDNAGDFIMVYAETPDKAPEFIPIELNSSDQRFKDLMVQIDNTIKYAHNFTDAIAGIATSGKLGTSQEITEQLQYMQSTVISPIQKHIEMAFTKIAKINGDETELKLNKYVIFDDATIKTAQSLEEGVQKIKLV